MSLHAYYYLSVHSGKYDTSVQFRTVKFDDRELGPELSFFAGSLFTMEVMT